MSHLILCPAGCCSLGDLLSRSSQMGVPVRDLLRLAPVLLGSASGPQFLQSIPLQAFWSWCWVLSIQDDSESHFSRPYTGVWAKVGQMTDFYLRTEEMRPFEVLWLTVSLEDCLNVTYLHKTTPQCGLFNGDCGRNLSWGTRDGQNKLVCGNKVILAVQ